MRLRHLLAAAPALAAVSLLAAGCGGDPSAAGVANLGATTTSSSSSSSSGDGTKASTGAAFSSCMRSHGVHGFPDPSSGGNLTIGPSSGIDPNSATFKNAQKACQHLLNIKPPSAAQQAQMQEQGLKFAACMRAHGVPKFPDPQFSPGTAQLRLDRQSGIDPNSPIFQAAQKTCQKLMPGSKNSPRQTGGVFAPGGGKSSSGK
jgi:hypothetical protein